MNRKTLLEVLVLVAVATALIAGAVDLATKRGRSTGDSYAEHIHNGAALIGELGSTKNRKSSLSPSLKAAAGEYQKALLIDPTGRDAVEGLATCYYRMSGCYSSEQQISLIDDAAYLFKKVVEETPDGPQKVDELSCIATADFLSGDQDAARAAADEAVSIDASARDTFFDGDNLKPPVIEENCQE